jgi:hypothetical protein
LSSTTTCESPEERLEIAAAKKLNTKKIKTTKATNEPRHEARNDLKKFMF